MPAKTRVITKRTIKSSLIDIEVWDEKTVENFPITEEHIGKPVRYASDPRSKKYILKEIKEPGDEYFPEGGYILDDSVNPYSLSVFLDEVIPFTKKKKKAKVKKANSQLARKKKSTKKKSTKKKKKSTKKKKKT